MTKPLQRIVCSKRKEFTSLSSKCFLFRVDPIQTSVEIVFILLIPLKEYPCFSSRKHVYIHFDHLKPNFYIVKLGFTGVYIIFSYFLLENIDCGYSLEPPWRGLGKAVLTSIHHLYF